MTLAILGVAHFERLRAHVGSPKGHLLRLGDMIVMWDAFRDIETEDTARFVPLEGARMSWPLPLFTVQPQ